MIFLFIQLDVFFGVGVIIAKWNDFGSSKVHFQFNVITLTKTCDKPKGLNGKGNANVVKYYFTLGVNNI